MKSQTTKNPIKLGAVTLVAALWPLTSGATLDIPDFPLFLTSTGVPPNVVVTLDDSGSMSRAFTPDICGNPDDICDSNWDSRLTHRYVKSSNYNPLYYNPSITYTPPVDASGTAYATSFNAAYRNGYDQPFGSVDLSTSYQPSAGLYLNNSDKHEYYMEHYPGDLTTIGTVWTTHADTGTMQGTNSGEGPCQ